LNVIRESTRSFSSGHPVGVPRERVDLPMISIVIKALNEEAKIARCIESAIAALSEIQNPSEIVLADSVSVDRTVEIAQRYPIVIVQFRHPSERGCGAAVQLGFQHSRGDFVMLLDGDMALLPGFLPRALEKFAYEPTLAGVAGLVEDTRISNIFDRNRAERGFSNAPRQSAKWLSGGGLYRRAAIVEAGGYAADRNLKAWEEAELGLRLIARGWSLARIDFPSTMHTGHAASTAKLLRSMWRSRRAMADGVLIRRAAGTPWMASVVKLQIHPILVILMWGGAIAVFAIAIAMNRWIWVGWYWAVVVFLLSMFAVHKGSVKKALVSFGIWHFRAAALLMGLREQLVSPTEPIASFDLSLPGPG